VDSRNQNNDGCNPDASVNVLIEDCEFNTGDDGVAIKSGRDQDAWRIGQAAENIIIRNCVVNSKINGLCIGSEMSGGVRNVFIENCKISQATSVLYCKSNFDRGGIIENVYMRNIEVDFARDALIRLDTNYKGHRGNQYPPVFRKFLMQDITCDKAENYVLYIRNVPGGIIENIVLKDITVNSAQFAGFYQNVSDIDLINVSINGEIQKSESVKSNDSKNINKRIGF
jgi:polygalacturonase